MGFIFLTLMMIVVEILVWIFVGKLVGSAWYVFFWFIIAMMLGMSLFKNSASQIMPQLQQLQMSAMTGMHTDIRVGKYLARCLAGILLMIPGLITDIFALLILIPQVSSVVQKLILSTLQKRQVSMMSNMMGGSGTGGFADIMRQMQDMQNSQNNHTIIDGEATEIYSDTKRIEHKK